MLYAGKERIEAESRKHRIEHTGGKQLRLSEAERISFRKGNRIFVRFLPFDIGKQLRDKRRAVAKGLSETFQVIRLTVIVFVKGTEAQDEVLTADFPASGIGDTPVADEPKVVIAVRQVAFDMHRNTP
jgi:hypothetical protein